MISRGSSEVHMNFIECPDQPSNFAHSSGEGCRTSTETLRFPKHSFCHAVPSLSKKQYLGALILGWGLDTSACSGY